MDTGTIIAATGYTVGLVVTALGLFIKMTTDAALASQKHAYLQEQVNKLELRVNEIGDHAVLKIDKMQESLQKMEININKILNKVQI